MFRLRYLGIIQSSSSMRDRGFVDHVIEGGSERVGWLATKSVHEWKEVYNEYLHIHTDDEDAHHDGLLHDAQNLNWILV